MCLRDDSLLSSGLPLYFNLAPCLRSPLWRQKNVTSGLIMLILSINYTLNEHKYACGLNSIGHFNSPDDLSLERRYGALNHGDFSAILKGKVGCL